ncbi:metallophosphoesterase [Sutterella sp.]|uniref:metallophosphoesterase n=1 Tax=Sutterella sp. TaxID=1981025 RepID=UPI0026DF6693|nr:metallophosphoesterase [Sutterella sp.]MDO5532473.1 metallophosphoesterase [Sutterella sp.]
MKRRLFLRTAAGLFAAPAAFTLAGAARAATPTEAQITLPAAENIISSFGWITDIHYCTSPIRTIPAEDSIRVYAHSLAKMRQAIELFNTRKLDFAIELGDFKDCLDNGDRPGTIAFLETVESEFRRYNGPRYHVCGNHDFDLISLGDFIDHTENAGDAKGKTYYSFVKGGVKYIVLDACYNNMEGEHYSLGKLSWKIAMIPTVELEWLKKELSSGTEPVVVFTHQLLNTWDEQPQNIPNDFFMRNAADVVKVLEESRRVLAVISGHFHKGAYSERNGIHYYVAQGMVERPLPHSVCGMVHIDRNYNLYIEGVYNERSRICKKA